MLFKFYMLVRLYVCMYAKQKDMGYKKVRGQEKTATKISNTN